LTHSAFLRIHLVAVEPLIVGALGGLLEAPRDERGVHLKRVAGQRRTISVTEEGGTKGGAMQMHVIWLRGAAIAALAAGSISLPMMSIAQAQQRPEATPVKLHRAGYNYDYRWSEREVYHPPRNPAAYHGHFALPEFTPDYHGSNGG
jgi:hypothetical protein